jgi:hypothetical protein
MSKAISESAAYQISKLIIEREHKVRLAHIWERSEAGDEVNENYFWLWQCEAELEALEIEETLLNDFGIKMRDSDSSVTLEAEIKLITSCVIEAKRSRAAA